MKVLSLGHDLSVSQQLIWTVLRRVRKLQYIGVRQHCLCGAQSPSLKRDLLSVNHNHEIHKVQKRFKEMEQQSDIGVHFPFKEKVKRQERTLDTISAGLERLRKGIHMYKQEWIDAFDSDKFPEHGDFKYFQCFNSDDSVKRWLLSTDQDTGQGKSTATFTTTSRGTAVFQGNLNTDVPKDGITKRAGYCNIMSPVNEISFERERPYDWTRYTHMFLKIRGDGRNYMVVVQMHRYFDIHQYDMYNFPVFTRGGPYWQYVKIPFSNFLISCQGRAQDLQQTMPLDKIKYMGITAGDKVNGPFKLEIDYIALVRDELTHTVRDFKYELYQKQNWET